MLNTAQFNPRIPLISSRHHLVLLAQFPPLSIGTAVDAHQVIRRISVLDMCQQMQEGRVGMTPSRGGLDASLSTKSPHPYKLEGRWCLVFLSLLWGTHGFVLVPGNGPVRAGLFYEQRATDPVCRLMESKASSGGGDGDTPPPPLSSGMSDADAEDSMKSGAGETEGGTPPIPFSTVSQGAEAGSDKTGETVDAVAEGVDESTEASTISPPIVPTVEELKRDFPNAPKAPWSRALDAKDFKAEDLIAGQMEVSYGGQPGARRAIADFERVERERIHLSTAARVLNFEREAAERERKDAQPKAKPEDDMDWLLSPDEWHPFPDPGPLAVYKWDKKPQLITFSTLGVLYNYVEPIGLIMREALGRAHNWRHRLPGPDFFEKHFFESFRECSRHVPSFGFTHNLSSQEWWFHVFTESYLKTILEFGLNEDIVFDVIDVVTDELYFEIMVGPEGWELMPDVGVVLNRLAEWRDRRGGPKLAVIANEDERLHVLLENLGILPYFDFVLTSRETGHEMPSTRMFEIAMETARVEDPRKTFGSTPLGVALGRARSERCWDCIEVPYAPCAALHIGYEYGVDITAACEVGWEACCVRPLQSDFEAEGEPYEYHRLIRIDQLLTSLGMPGLEKTTIKRRRGQWWGDPKEDAFGPAGLGPVMPT